MRHDPAPPEPTSAYDSLAQIIRELDPGRHAGADAAGRRHRRPLSQPRGMQTYGYLPLELPEGFEPLPLVHIADERMPAAALAFGVEAIARAIDALSAMRLLVLGGTKFLGRHAVDAALEAGHDVTIFTRGQTNPELFPEAEHLHGDRDGELDALAGRTWDGVVDTSGYVPRIVRQSAELLRDARRPLRLRLEHLRVRATSAADRRVDGRRGARATRRPRRSWRTTARSRPRASTWSRRSTATAALASAQA